MNQPSSSRRTRRRILASVLTALLTVGVAAGAPPYAPAPAAAAAVSAKYSPALAATLALAGPEAQISVMVQMTGRADLNLPVGPRAVQRRELILRLQALQALRHPLLLARLALWKALGQVTAYESFWVDNGIAVTGTAAVIATIAGRADVESIDLDTGQIRPASVTPTNVVRTSATSATSEPNITATGAPSLWSQGITGTGVVVANLDTGVDPTNPDLAASWRGGTDSWFDPYGQNATPADSSGHGTWTMGLMVGAGAGGTNIGMAPGARWIAAKIFNNSGTASLSAIHAALQWVLDPDNNPATDDAADVVNNSWTSAAPGCSTQFQPDLLVLRSAGVLPVFAAGNGGPGSSTSLSPANLPEAFAVGGIDANGVIDSGSSRGPSSCTGVPVYPSVVAPDVNLTVADLYGLYTTSTGTSFAAPEAAGALALVLSRVPNLTANQQALALTAGATDLGPFGPDNTFGWGAISAPAALAAAQAACVGATTTLASALPATVSTNPPTVSAHSAACTGHTVAGAEWFLDTAGAPGTGTPFTVSVPAFGAAAVDETVALPAAVLASLSAGPHVVLIDAVDDTGTWGPVASTTFVVDRIGPATSGVSASPSAAAPGATVVFTAAATDPPNGAGPGSTVAGAEWFDGADPGPGAGHPMNPADGAFNTATEALTVTVVTSGWAAGAHTISVRARDAVGNWGAAATSTLTLTVPIDSIFADGFESGTMSAWSGSSGGTRLAVTTAARLVGQFGLAATLGGASYVQDTTPTAEPSYHARFAFHPNGSLPGTGNETIFAGLSGTGQTLVAIVFHRTTAGAYQVAVQALSGNSTTTSAWTTITNASHTLELAWTAGTAGSVSLLVDGASSPGLTKLASSTQRLETVRLGPSAGVAASTRGTEYFDAFASTHATPIGPP